MADEDTSNRATVFGSIAEDYARLRPPPCAAAVDWLLPEGAGRVLDLAAGAGTLTRMLAERVPEVVAVEPDERMREVLAARNPGVAVHEGTAEDIALPDATFDAVVVSSAWHWFDPARAVPEIARVLRPGGRLSVVWNGLDGSVPWVEQWRAELRGTRAARTAAKETAGTVRESATGTGGGAGAESRVRRDHFARGEQLTGTLTAPGSPFAPPEHDVFTCTRPTTPADAAALLGTYSRLLILPDDQRAELIARAERSLLDRPDLLSPGGTVALPFRSLCWRASRLGPHRAAHSAV
jgi:SAM-dependent methyltransferase